MKKALLILLATYLWLNIPTVHDGLFHVYDNVQVTRIEAMYKELSSGQFPVRYIDSFGHGAGYFLFKYYSPLLYYIGAAFMYLGFSAIKAVKLIYLLTTLTGAVGSYVWIRSQTKHNWSATLGAVAFLSAPYVYHDFFHRGSMPEAGALMLMPWAMWAFGKLKQNPSTRNIGVAAVVFGLLILTHTLTGVMMGALLVLYLIINFPPLQVAVRYVLALCLAMGVSALSLVPALLEKSTIQYENNSLLMRGYLDHPVSLSAQLANQGVGGEKSAYLGFTLLSVYFLLLILISVSQVFRDKHGKITFFILTAASLGLYLISPSSEWLWERVMYLRYFQFPFRLLTVVSVVLTLGLATLSDYFRESKMKSLMIGMVVALPLLYGRSYYQPLGYQYGTTYTVDDPCRTTTWADEYLTKWVSKCLLSPLPSLVTPLSGEVAISDIETLEHGRVISFKTTGTGELQVAKYYAAEWVASDETGKILMTSPHGEHGLIKVEIMEEDTQVRLQMLPSLAAKWGDAISLIALLICASMVILQRSQRYDNSN